MAGSGKEGEVLDKEVEESLLVQREWQSHMWRRVKVKLCGGCRAGWSLEMPYVRLGYLLIEHLLSTVASKEMQDKKKSLSTLNLQEGYRDGPGAGKAVTLQQGFNQDYK